MIGKALGKYRIEEKLGEGGMGAVYKGFDTVLERYVAIKILPELAAQNEELVKRFENEAKAAARLEHPNIVQVHDFGHSHKIYYLVLQFVSGMSLADKVKELGPLAVGEAAFIISESLKALEKAHSMGIVHRDIKPDNIMISEEGEVKVTDFGIAKIKNDTQKLTMTGQIMGTPHYMSPEQCKGEAVDGRSDLYSLGVTFYYLLAGNPPFDAGSALAILNMQVEKELPDLRKSRPDLPESMIQIINKMSAKDPDHRFSSAREILQALQNPDSLPEGEDVFHESPTLIQKGTRNVTGGGWTNGRETVSSPEMDTSRRGLASERASLLERGKPVFLGVGILVLIFLAFFLFPPADSSNTKEGQSQNSGENDQEVAQNDKGDKGGKKKDEKDEKKEGKGDGKKDQGEGKKEEKKNQNSKKADSSKGDKGGTVLSSLPYWIPPAASEILLFTPQKGDSIDFENKVRQKLLASLGKEELFSFLQTMPASVFKGAYFAKIGSEKKDSPVRDHGLIGLQFEWPAKVREKLEGSGNLQKIEREGATLYRGESKGKEVYLAFHNQGLILGSLPGPVEESLHRAQRNEKEISLSPSLVRLQEMKGTSLQGAFGPEIKAKIFGGKKEGKKGKNWLRDLLEKVKKEDLKGVTMSWDGRRGLSEISFHITENPYYYANPGPGLSQEDLKVVPPNSLVGAFLSTNGKMKFEEHRPGSQFINPQKENKDFNRLLSKIGQVRVHRAGYFIHKALKVWIGFYLHSEDVAKVSEKMGELQGGYEIPSELLPSRCRGWVYEGLVILERNQSLRVGVSISISRRIRGYLQRFVYRPKPRGGFRRVKYEESKRRVQRRLENEIKKFLHRKRKNMSKNWPSWVFEKKPDQIIFFENPKEKKTYYFSFYQREKEIRVITNLPLLPHFLLKGQ